MPSPVPPRNRILFTLAPLVLLFFPGGNLGVVAQQPAAIPGAAHDAPPLSEEVQPEEVQARIDSAVNQILSATGVPSASVAIVEGGRIVDLRAYGKARLSPTVDAQPAMQYPIGSISKQFAAAAVLLLAQAGRLTLDDPVSKYLPDLTRAGEVTIRMLLSHTSGYQDYWPEDYVMRSLMTPTTVEHILNVWGKKPLDFDPGTRWQYSNTNFVIAGTIVQQVSGQPLMEFLRQRIFTPLAMEGVYDADANPLPPRDPAGYYRHALGPWRPAPQQGAGWMFGAGELAMPARDLALWDISLLRRSLLKPASYTQMFTPVLLKDGTSSGYGLGVFLGKREGHDVIEHSGEVSGFVSENLVFPSDDAAIVVLTNEDASPAAAMIGRQLTPLVLGLRSATAAEAQAEAIFTGLEEGQLNRDLLTENCNAYFTPQAIDDFAASLKPLGKPLRVTQTRQEERGGMIFREFTVDLTSRKLTVTTYEMPDGKLEQYLVMP